MTANTGKTGNTEHDWRKCEPVTAGARPVWVCRRCRQYRTQEPMRYDIGTCEVKP